MLSDQRDYSSIILTVPLVFAVLCVNTCLCCRRSNPRSLDKCLSKTRPRDVPVAVFILGFVAALYSNPGPLVHRTDSCLWKGRQQGWEVMVTPEWGNFFVPYSGGNCCGNQMSFLQPLSTPHEIIPSANGNCSCVFSRVSAEDEGEELQCQVTHHINRELPVPSLTIVRLS